MDINIADSSLIIHYGLPDSSPVVMAASQSERVEIMVIFFLNWKYLLYIIFVNNSDDDVRDKNKNIS